MSKKRELALITALLALYSGMAMARVPSTHGNIDEYTGSATCLQCHSKMAGQVMASIHWTWEHTDTATGQQLGKNRVINNYCIALPSNEPRCTSCHIGIGYADKNFDFGDSSKIDCLVCHDTTGTYKKVPTGAGVPDPTLDLLAIAQKAGTPNRNNCGACHFYGGGGDAVKHGDLDSTMANPSRELDVHMGGMNFTCANCHTRGQPNKHVYAGSRYSQPAPDNALCESCHTATPSGHTAVLNTHTDRVACQTCHIPAYARGGKATKMWWDWSTAGQKNEQGQPYVVNDADGNPIYDSKKGTFVWEKDVVPEYVWFNGTVTYATMDDVIDPQEVLPINSFSGSEADANARIVPVKRFRGIQPYDAGTGRLAIPHLFGTDSNAYWKTYDWTASLTAGNAYVGAGFTGPVGFVETEMLWVQNHMVAPKEQALSCTDCHTAGSRLNFFSLGYAPARAASLQTMMGGKLWSRYAVHADGHSVYTGTWLDWIDVAAKPWIYIYALSGYSYLPEDAVADSGAWAFLGNPGDYVPPSPSGPAWSVYPLEADGHTVYTGSWLGWVDVGSKPWVYVYDLDGYVFIPEESVMTGGAWGFIAQ